MNNFEEDKLSTSITNETTYKDGAVIRQEWAIETDDKTDGFSLTRGIRNGFFKIG